MNDESDNFDNLSPFKHLVYCTRCCLPSTSEDIGFDEAGICKACESSEEKMKIDWHKRQGELKKILESAAKSSKDNYDCMVPISGGKDSAFQLHILTKKYKLKPLAVTFSHNWYSKTGWDNLWNVIEKLDVDHIMYTPKRSLVNRLARKSLPAIGDSCWHCHAGVLSFPLHIAVKFGIKLLVFGESSAEFSSRDTFLSQKLDLGCASKMYDVFMKISVQKGPEKMVSKEISRDELVMFFPPSKKDLDKNHIKAIYLGDYIFWDQERQTEFLVNEYGWKEDKVEGTYKRYKSVECKMPGVHDYAKYIKRGFGRATDFVSQDIRAGLMTREEGFKIAKKIDAERPKALDYYLKVTGYTEEEFLDILKKMRKGSAKKLP